MKKLNLLVIAVALVSGAVSAETLKAEFLQPVAAKAHFKNELSDDLKILGSQEIAYQLLEAEYKLNPKQENMVLFTETGIFTKLDDVKNYNVCKKVGDEVSQCQLDKPAMEKMKAEFLAFGKYAKAHGAKTVSSASTSDLHQELVKPQIVGE